MSDPIPVCSLTNLLLILWALCEHLNLVMKLEVSTAWGIYKYVIHLQQWDGLSRIAIRRIDYIVTIYMYNTTSY